MSTLVSLVVDVDGGVGGSGLGVADSDVGGCFLIGSVIDRKAAETREKRFQSSIRKGIP